MELLSDVRTDDVVKQIDISYNISIDEANVPSKLSKFITQMGLALEFNTCLTALDIAGNHLGDYTPHPSNGDLICFYFHPNNFKLFLL